MSRFPKITETFVLREMRILLDMGADIRIFPLVRERDAVVHPEVAELDRLVCHRGFLSLAVLGSHLYWVLACPKAYLASWISVFVGNIRSPRFLLRGVGAMWKAAWFARKATQSEVDCIHAHWATHPALTAYLVHRLTGLPYSFTIHAHDLYVDRSMLERKLQAAAFAVTISNHNKRLITRWCGPESASRVRVIRLGVDLLQFVPPSARQAPPPFRLVCVAGLEPYKGHRYLVAACRLLAEQGIPFCCTCIGDGPLRPEIEMQIRECGLNDKIVLKGARPWEDVVSELSRAHGAVLASVVTASGKTEGIPVALMEAMAMEVPVVATDVSGVSELVRDGHNGFLVRPGAPAELADALMHLYRHPELQSRMGRNGRLTVESAYDLRRNVGALFECLQCGARRRNPDNMSRSDLALGSTA